MVRPLTEWSLPPDAIYLPKYPPLSGYPSVCTNNIIWIKVIARLFPPMFLLLFVRWRIKSEVVNHEGQHDECNFNCRDTSECPCKSRNLFISNYFRGVIFPHFLITRNGKLTTVCVLYIIPNGRLLLTEQD